MSYAFVAYVIGTVTIVCSFTNWLRNQPRDEPMSQAAAKSYLMMGWVLCMAWPITVPLVMLSIFIRRK